MLCKFFSSVILLKAFRVLFYDHLRIKPTRILRKMTEISVLRNYKLHPINFYLKHSFDESLKTISLLFAAKFNSQNVLQYVVEEMSLKLFTSLLSFALNLNRYYWNICIWNGSTVIGPVGKYIGFFPQQWVCLGRFGYFVRSSDKETCTLNNVCSFKIFSQDNPATYCAPCIRGIMMNYN